MFISSPFRHQVFRALSGAKLRTFFELQNFRSSFFKIFFARLLNCRVNQRFCRVNYFLLFCDIAVWFCQAKVCSLFELIKGTYKQVASKVPHAMVVLWHLRSRVLACLKAGVYSYFTNFCASLPLLVVTTATYTPRGSWLVLTVAWVVDATMRPPRS